MPEIADRLNEELDRLRAVRDELRVRLHLGRSEIRDRPERHVQLFHADRHPELGLEPGDGDELVEALGGLAVALDFPIRIGLTVCGGGSTSRRGGGGCGPGGPAGSLVGVGTAG